MPTEPMCLMRYLSQELKKTFTGHRYVNFAIYTHKRKNQSSALVIKLNTVCVQNRFMFKQLENKVCFCQISHKKWANKIMCRWWKLGTRC